MRVPDWEGSVGVVIGGTSGFGLATAEALAGLGASVVVGARSRDRIDAVAGEHPGIEGRTVDLTDPASIERFFAPLDRVDFLVISAAELPSGRLLDTDLSALRPAVDSRLFGSLAAVKAAVPLMPEHGSIVLFSGTAARKGFAGESLGSASCGAVESVVRSLALELAPHRINAISPGSAMTPVFRQFFGEHAEQAAVDFAATLPLKRLADPAEIAHAVLWLLSNTYVTGSTLIVDGGQSIT